MTGLLFVLVSGLVWAVLQLLDTDESPDDTVREQTDERVLEPPPPDQQARNEPPQPPPHQPAVPQPVVDRDPARPGPVGVVSTQPVGKTPPAPVPPVAERPPTTEGAHSVPNGGLPVDTVGSFPVEVQVRSSELSVFPERTFYRFGAALTNAIGEEITQLVVTLDVLDSSDAVLASRDLYVVSQNSMNVRPGDMRLAGTSLETSDQAVSVQLTVKTVDTQPITQGVLSSAPLPLENWSAEPGFAISVVERERRLTPSLNPPSQYLRTVFEVSNTGTRPIEVLQLSITPHGRTGDYESYSFFPVASSGPPLLPGDTVLVSRTGSAAGETTGYSLRVDRLR